MLRSQIPVPFCHFDRNEWREVWRWMNEVEKSEVCTIERFLRFALSDFSPDKERSRSVKRDGREVREGSVEMTKGSINARNNPHFLL